MNQVYKKIDESKSEIIEFLKKLVSIPTVNPPGKNYAQCVDFLEKKLKRLGLKTKKIHVPKKLVEKLHPDGKGYPRIILIAEWNVGAKKTLHINGHYDVVPVGKGWKTNPFKPVIKNGKMFGRGTADMKAGLTAMCFAVQTLKKLNLKPKYNIQLSFVPDEESGGETGTGYLIKKIKKPDFVFIAEGSRHSITNAHKGVLWLKIKVKGKSAHAAYPHLGVNAFEKMIKMGAALIDYQKELRKRKIKNIVKKEEGYSTMTMGGVVQGGVKINTVPDEVSFTIDRRILPSETTELATKEIMDIIKKLKKKDKDLKVEVEVLQKDEPVFVAENKEICKIAAHAVEKITGKKAKFDMLSGATDVRFFTKKGAQGAGFSVNGENCHADNEFIYIKDFIIYVKFLAQMMLGG